MRTLHALLPFLLALCIQFGGAGACSLSLNGVGATDANVDYKLWQKVQACPGRDPLSVTHIYLEINSLTKVPNLQNFTNVVYINLRSNQIAKLLDADFVNNPKLTDVIVYHNLINSIDSKVFAKQPDLLRFHVHANRLTSLPAGLLDNAPNFRDFVASSNVITCFPSGFFSKNPKLSQININDNNMRAGCLTPAMFPTTINTLYLQRNPLLFSGKYWDLSIYPNLNHVNFGFNNFKEIPAGLFNAQGSNLRNVYLPGNQFTSIPVGLFDMTNKLNVVNFESNRGIKSFPDKLLDAQMELTQLAFSASGLTYIPPLHFFPKLNYFAAHSNYLTEIKTGTFDKNPELYFIHLCCQQITMLPPAMLPNHGKLTELYIYNNRLPSLPPDLLSTTTSVSTLYMYQNKLTSLPPNLLDQATRMSNLRMFTNQFTSMPPSIFRQMCTGGTINQLYWYDTPITEIPAGAFDGCTSLRTLVIPLNKITSLAPNLFQFCTMVSNLQLDRNGITELPSTVLHPLKSLTHFYMYNNKVVSFPSNLFHENPNLQFHHWSGNQVTSLPDGLYDKNPQIYYIQGDSNKLVVLPSNFFKKLPAVREIRFSANQITVLEDGIFDQNPAIQIVGFHSNKLTVLQPNLIANSPNVYDFHFCCQQITEIPVGFLDNNRKMKNFYLYSNRIGNTLPLGLFDTPELYTLQLQSNPSTMRLPPHPFQYSNSLWRVYVPGAYPIDSFNNNTHNSMNIISGAGCSDRQMFNWWGQCRQWKEGNALQYKVDICDTMITNQTWSPVLASSLTLDPGECQEFCKATPGCSYFSFHVKPPSTPATCNIFAVSANPGATGNAGNGGLGVVSGLVACDLDARWFRTRKSTQGALTCTDLPQSGSTCVQGLSTGSCAKKCDNITSCNAFRFGFTQKQCCYQSCSNVLSPSYGATTGWESWVNRACRPCAITHYRSGCDLLRTGSCNACGACPYQQYRKDCGTEYPHNSTGVCTPCSGCSPGQYKPDCALSSPVSPGTCVGCPACPADHYRTGCAGPQTGNCTQCRDCAEGQYNKGCGGTTPGVCTMCAVCPLGQWLSGCTKRSPGVCTACPTCDVGKYRFGCSGRENGTCTACLMCPDNKFKEGCSGTSPGACKDCADCPDGQYMDKCGKEAPFDFSGTCKDIASKPIEVTTRTMVTSTIPISGATDMDNTTSTALQIAFTTALAVTTGLDPSMMTVETKVVDGSVVFTAIISKTELATVAKMVEVDNTVLANLLAKDESVKTANGGNFINAGDMKTDVGAAPSLIPPTPPTPIPYNFHRPVWTENLKPEDVILRPTSWMVCSALVLFAVLLPVGCSADSKKDRLSKMMRKEGIVMATHNIDVASFLAHHGWLSIYYRNPDSLVRSKERVCLLTFNVVCIAAALTSPYGREPRLLHVWWIGLVAALPAKFLTYVISKSKRNLSKEDLRRAEKKNAKKAAKKAQRQLERAKTKVGTGGGNPDQHVLGDKDLPVWTSAATSFDPNNPMNPIDLDCPSPLPPPPPVPRMSPRPIGRGQFSSVITQGRVSHSVVPSGRTGRKFLAPREPKQEVAHNLEKGMLLEQLRGAAAAPLPNTKPAPPRAKKRGVAQSVPLPVKLRSDSPKSSSTKRGKSPSGVTSPNEIPLETIAWNAEGVYEEVAAKKKRIKAEVYVGSLGGWVRTVCHLLLFILTIAVAGFAVLFGQRDDALMIQFSLLVVGSIIVFEPLFFAIQVGMCQKRQFRR